MFINIGEKFSELSDISRLKNVENDSKYGGAIIYSKDGINYADISESHILNVGNTGSGKTSCVTKPFVYNSIISGQSVIVVDPKLELYTQLAGTAEKTHNVICVDFANPRSSPHKWNPLKMMYALYQEYGTITSEVNSAITVFVESLISKIRGSSDKFWENSAEVYLRGLLHLLLEYGNESEANVKSFLSMIVSSEEKVLGTGALKTIYNNLPADSVIRSNLSPYVNAATETKASIYSVASTAANSLGNCEDIVQMLSSPDSIDITSLDIDEKPIAIFINIAGFDPTFHSLAGILVDQLTYHFISLAHSKYSDNKNRLPHKLNIVLEELPTIGNALSTLPQRLADTRSRNIRYMIVMQDIVQLEDVFGKSNAEAIESCIGLTYAFTSNRWESMKKLSERCGEKIIDNHGTMYKESLISPSKLSAMPVGTALILLRNQHKFVSHFPFFENMFDFSECSPTLTLHREADSAEHIPCFNLIEFANKLVSENAALLNPNHNGPLSQYHPGVNPDIPLFNFLSEGTDKKSETAVKTEILEKSVDEKLIGKIDNIITGIELSEIAEKNSNPKYAFKVFVNDLGDNRSDVILEIASFLDIQTLTVEKICDSLLSAFPFKSKKKAKHLCNSIIELGASAKIITVKDD